MDKVKRVLIWRVDREEKTHDDKLVPVFVGKLTLLVSTITLIIDEFAGRWGRYLSLHALLK